MVPYYRLYFLDRRGHFGRVEGFAAANDEKVVQMRPVPPANDGDAERRALKINSEIEQLSHGNAEIAAGPSVSAHSASATP